MSDNTENKENNNLSSIAYSLLDEEKLDSAEYFEFREKVKIFIDRITSTEDTKKHIHEIRQKLELLEKLEIEEDKTSNWSSRFSLGAILASILASMLQDLFPIGMVYLMVVLVSMAVLVSMIGYFKKISLDNKEVILAKQISEEIKRILTKIEKGSNEQRQSDMLTPRYFSSFPSSSLVAMKRESE